MEDWKILTDIFGYLAVYVHILCPRDIFAQLKRIVELNIGLPPAPNLDLTIR